MDWSGSDILQAISSFISLVIVGWLVGWIYRLYKEREHSLKERYEGKVDLLEERIKLKDEEINRERRARERHAEVVEEERKLWNLQRSAGIAPDGALPDKPIELPEELKHEMGEILTRLEQISIGLPLLDASMLISRGRAYSATKQYEKAIKAYSEAIELDSTDFVAYHNRGLARRNSGLLESAVDDFSKVIELRPDIVEGYCNRGRTYGLLEKYEQAIRDFDKVIEIDPEHVSAYWNRGAAYYHSGQVKKAVKDFDEATKHKQDESERCYCQACAYSLMNKPDEAVTMLQKAISLDKSYIEVAKTDKDFDNIRNDPRFKTLLSQ